MGLAEGNWGIRNGELIQIPNEEEIQRKSVAIILLTV